MWLWLRGFILREAEMGKAFGAAEGLKTESAMRNLAMRRFRRAAVPARDPRPNNFLGHAGRGVRARPGSMTGSIRIGS
jgi:hypothetical protein